MLLCKYEETCDVTKRTRSTLTQSISHFASFTPIFKLPTPCNYLLWKGSTRICCLRPKLSSISFFFTHWIPRLGKLQLISSPEIRCLYLYLSIFFLMFVTLYTKSEKTTAQIFSEIKCFYFLSIYLSSFFVKWIPRLGKK